MENPLQKYVGRNVLPYLTDCTFNSGKTKDGGTYYYITVKFKNGFEKRLFLNSSDVFGIKDAMNTVDATNNFKDLTEEQ